MKKSKGHFEVFKAVISDVTIFEIDVAEVLLLAS